MWRKTDRTTPPSPPPIPWNRLRPLNLGPSSTIQRIADRGPGPSGARSPQQAASDISISDEFDLRVCRTTRPDASAASTHAQRTRRRKLENLAMMMAVSIIPIFVLVASFVEETRGRSQNIITATGTVMAANTETNTLMIQIKKNHHLNLKYDKETKFYKENERAKIDQVLIKNNTVTVVRDGAQVVRIAANLKMPTQE